MESEHNHILQVGQLFIVATPIGNLGDISFRAVETLKNVDLIAAEDTRLSHRLLAHYQISTPLIACHEHNERDAAPNILKKLQDGLNIALITDAGTPLISDPGYRLVSTLRDAGIRITPIPGACAPIAALCASGLPTDCFTFTGFLPRAGRARKEALQQIAETTCTHILFESPRRLLRTLNDLTLVCEPERQICMAREITKIHEEIITGRMDEIIKRWKDVSVRGEIVLIIKATSRATEMIDESVIIQRLTEPEIQSMPPSVRAKHVAQELHVSRDQVYALLLKQKSTTSE